MSLMPFSQSLEVIRSYGEYEDGEWVEHECSRFSIRGSIQPGVPELQRQALPEGIRQRRLRTLFCAYNQTELRAAVVEEYYTDISAPPDRVVYNNREWEVHQFERWDTATGGTLAHSEYLLVARAEDETDV